MIKFELRRGDEDSAPPEELDFQVIVSNIIGDELKMRYEFKKPGMVSIGSQPDVIIAEITNANFFSQADGTM